MRRKHPDWIKAGFIIILAAMAAMLLVVWVVVRSAEHRESEAERELGAGAVCQEDSRTSIVTCVYRHEEYRCVRSSGRTACAKVAAP